MEEGEVSDSSGEVSGTIEDDQVCFISELYVVRWLVLIDMF